MLEKAAQLPDDQLAALIYAVVSAAGGSQKQAKAAIANADKLKKKLHAASDRELQELIAGLDPSYIRQLRPFNIFYKKTPHLFSDEEHFLEMEVDFLQPFLQ